MTFVAPDIPPRLRGDAGRVRQVLLNLIGNAVKFTDAGEVVVRAALEADTPTHVTLRLTVSDTGPGLPESARPHLFKPFMRADSGVTQPLGGAGLGLPIARRLVELMGGAIGLESGGPESHGATFWFTARFERAPETPPPEPPALTVGRVLVVDDSRTSLEFVQHYLIDGGVSAGGARTSAEALAQLRRAAAAHDPYRVALIDYHLPEMDGFAVARAIQADVRLAETKLVLFTAHAEPGLAERAQQAGFAAYITKPIKREELFETLRAISSPAAQPAARPTRRGAVLLVEDNQVNRRVVQLQLKKLGYTVQTVNDGRAAVEAVARAEPPFGAILMDVQMPEMDGLTATRLIRQAETGTLSHIPIIALTAHARPSDRADCLAAGMDDFLSKPINVAQLRETLARWLAEGEPSAPESDRPAAGPLNTRA
jgi:CheY-like chemotaxis protein